MLSVLQYQVVSNGVGTKWSLVHIKDKCFTNFLLSHLKEDLIKKWKCWKLFCSTCHYFDPVWAISGLEINHKPFPGLQQFAEFWFVAKKLSIYFIKRDWLCLHIQKRLYLTMFAFHLRTAGPISTKLCTDLPTNLGKVLNTSMIPPTWPLDSGIPKTPNPKWVTGEKTLCNVKCPDGYLYTV